MNIAIRDGSLPLSAELSLFEALRAVGLSRIELQVDINLKPVALQTDDLAADLDRHDVQACALLLATDFSGDLADAHAQWAIAASELAAQLRVPVLRLDTFTAKRDLPAPVVQKNLIRHVQAIVDATQRTAVQFGLENHAFLSNEPAFLDAVLAELSADRVGLTLDTGNFYWFGHPLERVYELIEKYAPRVKHTHIKNINFPPDQATRQRPIGWEYGQYRCPLDEGNLDLRRIIKILGQSGYDGDLCIENEALSKFPPEQRLGVIGRDVAALRRAVS